MNISEGRLYEAMVEVRVYLTLREKLGWKSKTLSLGRNKVKFSELLDELKGSEREFLRILDMRIS
jgi:hypothetical protein